MFPELDETYSDIAQFLNQMPTIAAVAGNVSSQQDGLGFESPG